MKCMKLNFLSGQNKQILQKCFDAFNKIRKNASEK